MLVLPFSVCADEPSDQQVFPNRIEAHPPVQPSTLRVVGTPNPQRPSSTSSTLSPDNAPQMGIGVKIPLGGSGPKVPPPDADQESEQ